MPRCVAPLCQYKRRKCGKPNRWIEHMVHYGGLGLTRAEISDRYHRKIPSDKLSCRRARNRATDWRVNAALVAPSVWDYLEIPGNRLSGNINMKVLRRKVVKDMTKRNNTQRLSVNFGPGALTAARVKRLVKIIDKHFWKGTLVRTINRRMVGTATLKFEVVDRPEEAWEAINEFKMSDDNKLRMSTIKVNRAHFLVSGSRRSSGIQALNKLDALSIALQHELMHVLVNSGSYAKSSEQGQGGHGLVWRRAWHNFHGGSLHTYTYDDYPEIIQI